MKAKDLDYVRDTISNEGFHYTFTGYSHFEEVKDEEFHRLRKAYLEAGEKLGKYLNIDFEL